MRRQLILKILPGTLKVSNNLRKTKLAWNDFATSLATRFREAMQTTNPDVILELSDTGPVARFVTAAIPLITGETPTQVAVARHLQRKATKRARAPVADNDPSGLCC